MVCSVFLAICGYLERQASGHKYLEMEKSDKKVRLLKLSNEMHGLISGLIDSPISAKSEFSCPGRKLVLL